MGRRKRTLLPRVKRLLRALRRAIDTIPRASRRLESHVFATSVFQARDRRLTRLSGILRHADDSPPIFSPLTGERCVYALLQIDGWLPPKRQKTHDRGWRRLTDAHRLCDRFHLDDGTAEALVEVGALAPEATARLESSLPAFKPLPKDLVRRLRHDGILAAPLPRAPRYRYRQLILREDDPLAIIGICRREPDPDPRAAADYRSSATRVRMVPPWFGPLRIDAPNEA
ncbi:MAG: hypothetical protein KAI47_11570 [Deltaproteobacteria bacterium]|nr:hypothetical protein [Deltaproteobacteria bacterium]